MIEIITEKVKMPALSKRRFQKECKNNKWFVMDTEAKSIIYRGKFEDVSLVAHNFNKKYYRDLAVTPNEVQK